MLKSIVVTVPHDLGAEVARRRVADGLERLKRDYADRLAQSSVIWTENRAEISVIAFGYSAGARLDVEHDLLRIEVRLPWLLAALGGKIRAVLSSSAETALKLGHEPTK